MKDIGIVLILTIPDDLVGQRTDSAITKLAVAQQQTLSRARLQALLSNKYLYLNDIPVTNASRKVKLGEVYQLVLPPAEKAEPAAQEIPLTIVYEDGDLIVVDKPAGLVVHPAPGNREHTLVNGLLAHCGDKLSGIGGVARPGIVHRLDKDTSGLIVIAKNDLAHQALAKQFADRSLSRTYHALVWGTPIPLSGSVNAPIGRSSKDRKKMAVTGKGKKALTHYRVIEDFGDTSLIECKLETGRTHQIRVHLAHIKHPVVGDPIYGHGRTSKNQKVINSFPRQALHAVSISFIHPRTNKPKTFTSRLPKDMANLIKTVRRSCSP